MITHLNDFNSLVNELPSIKMKIEEDMKVILLFYSLPKRWESMAMKLNNSFITGILIFNDVTSVIMSHEM